MFSESGSTGRMNNISFNNVIVKNNGQAGIYFINQTNTVINKILSYNNGWADWVNGGFSRGYNHGNLATAPTPFGEGDEYYDTTDHRKYYYNGSAWQQ